jgi:probable rRNA maturation factor
MAPESLTVDVRIECPGWRKAWPKAAIEIRQLLRAAAKRPEIASTATGEVAVVLADDVRLRALNAQFRGKDRPTNVLSFPDTAVPLGGMAIAFETISREAIAQKKPIIRHSKHLILHGFLHLLGYDHNSARAARLMEGLEVAILSNMGIPNPYVPRARSRA